MNLGFNSDVRLGETVYHVQTEDRGAAHPFIDTTVYFGGQVLHRRSSSYRDLLGSGEPSQAALQQRVEQQHRSVIEELHAGTLKLDRAAARRAGRRAGIRVQLLNPATWLVSGSAVLQVEVRARSTGEHVAGANVEVTVEGVRGPTRFAARTTSQGRAELTFPLPELGPGGATLVIRAAGSSGEDEIRYQLRPRAEPSAPQPPGR